MAPHADNFFIGDMKKGIFVYLLPVQDANGQVAIMEVRDTLFSLLPTEHPIPTKGPYGPIKYDTPVLADRQMQLGYIMGADSTGRMYIFSFEYAKRPAPVTLYYTDPLPNANGSQPVLTPEGHLITAGGIMLGGTYFTPSKDVWLFPVGQPNVQRSMFNVQRSWSWILLMALLLVAAGVVVWLYRRQRPAKSATAVAPLAEETTEAASDDVSNNELMKSICRLMEEKSLYLNSDLKMSDLAAALGVHQNMVSSCINSTGRSYSQFVNDYRIEYAKRLLQEDPDKKIATIYYESGFASEQTFFRAFKDRTGMTPGEWRTSPK